MIFPNANGSTVSIHNKGYTVIGLKDDKLQLKPMNDSGAPIEEFSESDIASLRATNYWRYYPSVEELNRSHGWMRQQRFALISASKEDRERALFVYMQVMVVRQLFETGTIFLTPQSLESNWQKFTDILYDREEARKLCGRILRAGEKLPSRRKPHRPATLLKKFRLLRARNYDISCLLPRYGQSRSDAGRLSAETEEFISDYIRAFADPDKPKKYSIADSCINAMEKENSRLREMNKPLLKASVKTVVRRIEAQDPFGPVAF